jgi:membrane-associated protease RseP (regulator of RpoE activity)
MMFVEPPPTRYDLQFRLLGFPVRVHPLFWLIAILLGGLGNPLSLLIWVAVVFASILVHELGHALMFRLFGRGARIVLYHMGGLTYPEGAAMPGGLARRVSSGASEILISLAGSGAGFLLVAVVVGLAMLAGASVGVVTLLRVIPLFVAYFPHANRLLNELLWQLIWVNVIWGVINLLPVYPLDGGNVARLVFQKVDPYHGMRKALTLSVATAVAVAVVGALLMRSLFFVFFYGLLALSNYEALRRA